MKDAPTGRHQISKGDEPILRFLIVNATSHPVRETRLDLTVARQVLGYEPRDRWPEGM